MKQYRVDWEQRVRLNNLPTWQARNYETSDRTSAERLHDWNKAAKHVRNSRLWERDLSEWRELK